MDKVTQLLKQIGKPNLKYLGKGMQSIVFEIDAQKVLKVYGEDIGVKNLLRLKTFYESLDTINISFETPLISEVKILNGLILVTEKRLLGTCPEKNFLQKMSQDELKDYSIKYLNALFEIKNIDTNFLQTAEPLDLSGQFFECKKYDNWIDLLTSNVERKYHESESNFIAQINNANQVYEKIKVRISQIQFNDQKLIHGDFCPANTMVDNKFTTLAVLDFGILTTVGDPIFDIALGWVFVDMYGEILTLDIKTYLEPMILERITLQEKERLYLYVLVYSFISANM